MVIYHVCVNRSSRGSSKVAKTGQSLLGNWEMTSPWWYDALSFLASSLSLFIPRRILMLRPFVIQNCGVSSRCREWEICVTVSSANYRELRDMRESECISFDHFERSLQMPIIGFLYRTHQRTLYSCDQLGAAQTALPTFLVRLHSYAS